MKRKRIDFHRLQNAEHFELHADVIALATEITPVALKSIEQCAEYKRLFAAEDAPPPQKPKRRRPGSRNPSRKSKP